MKDKKIDKVEKKLFSADDVSLACSEIMTNFITEGVDFRAFIYFSASLIDKLFDDKESEV